MTFNEYWNQYGELHAASCGGSIRLFAEEIWKSAQENAMSDAIPRAKVQAAVDEMTVRYWEGAECILHDVGERDHCEGCAFDQYPLPLCKSLACIAHHTGGAPSEVPHA